MGAPRDIVARGGFAESLKSEDNGATHNAYLEITHSDGDWLRKRFPSIDAHLTKKGWDLAKDHLPVIPAAHYTCGGVTTDMHGRTSLDGLYAAGEAARTGLHGGNRLASTSLLEGLVFGASVADFIGGSEEGKELEEISRNRLYTVTISNVDKHQSRSSSLEQKQIENPNTNRAVQLLSQVRRIMWNNVGLVRTPSGLATAMEALTDIQAEATELHQICPSLEASGVRDAACAGKLVATASAANRQSAGTHYVVPDDAVEEFSDDEEDEVASR